MSLYEGLAVEDIQNAADALRPVYVASGRADGFVSLEVSPYLANDTEGTIAEAERLWGEVKRPNLMIKVPGTAEGVPAIRELISDGINVNVTLLFSRRAYEAVAEAYLAGLEARATRGEPLSSLASVASFFVSRIDTAVDALLEKRMAAEPQHAAATQSLLGRTAIANAKLAYETYRSMTGTPRWAKLAAKSARPQRLLWASTSTKNPRYRDVIYVEQLIGPATVNTLPPATLEAFREHGAAAQTLEADLQGARDLLKAIADAGVDLDAVTDELLQEGLAQFVDAFAKLHQAIEARARTLAA